MPLQVYALIQGHFNLNCSVWSKGYGDIQCFFFHSDMTGNTLIRISYVSFRMFGINNSAVATMHVEVGKVNYLVYIVLTAIRFVNCQLRKMLLLVVYVSIPG